MPTTDDEARRSYVAAFEASALELGRKHAQLVGDDQRDGRWIDDISPSDRGEVVGRFVAGDRRDLDDALAAANAGYREWRSWPWAHRVGVMRRAADLIQADAYSHAALLTREIGKNWTDAMYDVQEGVDVIRYYCDQMEDNDGFVRALKADSTHESATSVMLPYGPWMVISPFNFAVALSAGPASAALLAGNSVIMKPSPEAPLGAFWFTEAVRRAGAPTSVINVVSADGPVVADFLDGADDLAGVVFTGSVSVGQQLQRQLVPRSKRVIAELGGKNPSIVMLSANVDDAGHGVARSAFGYAGQKCSANSRVYVQKQVLGAFLERLLHHTEALTPDLPERVSTVVGPVINRQALARFDRAVSTVASGGGRVLIGGSRMTEGTLAAGNFVQPTVVTGLPPGHDLLTQELFVPLIAVVPVSDLDEAIRLANDSPFGLAAGLYSHDANEVERFLNNIEAGVVYVNRRGGATTGARVHRQTFGGWKASGSSGANSYGEHYLPQFMREQSRTVRTVWS